MEELSNINRLRHREQLPQTQQTSLRPNSSTTTRAYQETEHEEDELNRDSSFLLDFDSLDPHSNSNSYFFIPDEYNASSNFGFNFNAEPDSWVCEYSDSLPDRNCRLCREGYDEPMNFVTDLFESREAQILDDPIREFDSGLSEDTRMEFGFGPGLGSDSIPLELGIRVEGSNAESDFGEFDVNSGFIVNDDDNYESFGVNEYRIIENQREEFEWEEVSERNQFDERENFDSVIDRIGGVLVSSNVPSPEGENSFLDVAEGELEEDDAEEEERNVEWEVLMTANNLDSDFGFENQEEYNNDREFARFDLPDDYTLTMEQWVENENAVKIGLPASKSVVENLPSVVLTVDEVQKNNDSVVCAVCKEDVAGGEKITRMPCFHLYHGDCILPWLEIRNTCPVCRYELPTDDADYEKRQRDSRLGW
ncbi:E3 ubiquitin-protein ligase Praja-2-like isoform X1 [Olea europaea var. sylvestris]|uniref:E3 ubiquitin-protein ligase Praja-2-like isoform X1 n=1 Tax=Olea europaea var. sylvestris TaxID=158386 RepID=UPI000C1D16C4|nr:E3 ubiquitin-protein ligase Praja-2-like isoform X1 [Olea europaea var. sylvestris]XP_022853036.1 E3 ubiquitin-protein ligase Praja-2-like isoform X1 [Olea europaea var. sylvestris]XP_022853037.1 E3 ubiquitin-protein ligase Praja-2-like isoform X1 [Olea europaea var. sylvestris]